MDTLGEVDVDCFWAAIKCGIDGIKIRELRHQFGVTNLWHAAFDDECKINPARITEFYCVIFTRLNKYHISFILSKHPIFN